MDLEAGDDGDAPVVVRQGLLRLDSRTPGEMDDLARRGDNIFN